MSMIEGVSYIDLIGYFGGGITLLSISLKTMIPLRVGAVCGNHGFMTFGFLAGSYPTFILHALLLPLNALRLVQMIRLVREIREASSENNLDPLLPYMRLKKENAGPLSSGFCCYSCNRARFRAHHPSRWPGRRGGLARLPCFRRARWRALADNLGCLLLCDLSQTYLLLRLGIFVGSRHRGAP